jgi:arylsulfatase A-like enzyme
MPLLVRLPQSLRPEEPIENVSQPTANIDLAPTILDLAGGEPCKEDGEDCRLLDGRSLVPLLRSPEPRWPQKRAVLIELDQAPKGDQKRARPCSFVGVRWRGQVYIRYRAAARPGGPCRPTSSVEHYDLGADPNQLENLAGTSRSVGIRKQLRGKLTELRGCEGNRAEPDHRPNPCE